VDKLGDQGADIRQDGEADDDRHKREQSLMKPSSRVPQVRAMKLRKACSRATGHAGQGSGPASPAGLRPRFRSNPCHD
jgi:hypothetical protein